MSRDFVRGGSSIRAAGRSASTDIFTKPHQANTFWQSMVNMQRVNNWNQNYTSNSTTRSRDRSAPAGGLLANIGGHSTPRNASTTNLGFGGSVARFGGNNNRSTTRSVSKGARNTENDFGVWGKKTTEQYYQNRDTSPAFGGGRVRAIKEDLETTSNYSGSSSHRGGANDFKSVAALTKKSQARFTYSQV